MKVTKTVPRIAAVAVLTAAMVLGAASSSAAATSKSGSHTVVKYQMSVNKVSHCKDMERPVIY